MDDFYNVLGVPRDAPPEAIRNAFRSAAKAAHPDAHPHLPPPEREALNRRFIRLAQAYETLSDPGRRAAYDRTLGPQPHTARPRPRAGTRPRAHARRAPRGTARPENRSETTGENLDELLRGVDDLLGRFGLDRRQPFEQILDELLAWALALFREVAGAFDGPGDEAKSGQDTQGGGTRGAAGSEGKARPRSGTARPTAGRQGGPDDGVDEELHDLKSRSKSGKKDSRSGSALDDELVRLKQQVASRGRKPS